MKKLTVILIFIANSAIIFGQSYKVMYELKWKPEKNSEKYNKELSTLITSKDGISYFESYEKFQSDSTKTKIIIDYEKKGSGQLRFPDSRNNSKFRQLIIKDLSKKTVTTENKFFIKNLQVDENCRLDWKIKNEKSKIFNYPVQKAELNYGGRKWVAWFTSEIPIFDGPYKFYGLPGLILKISDTENNYFFEIKGITKEENDISLRNFADQKPVKITDKQWKVFWDNYKKEPSMIFANLNTETTTYVIDGKDVNNKDVKDSFNKREIEIINSFEKNPIVLKSDCK